MSQRISRPLYRTMIIVCEDTNTAPNYLSHLKKQAIDSGYWYKIDILPKPPIEKIESVGKNNNPHKSKRQKRNFINTQEDELKELEKQLESENNEQPVRYVRIVQQALETEAYSEGWAVYDLDGHTGHIRAAEMAKNTPTVNVAFSSRSIELWFLLHFEQSNKIFTKVHCKIKEEKKGKKKQKEKVLNCNINNTCVDKECLVGYIKRNTPLENYAKNADIFPEIRSNIRMAIINSELLRKQYPVELPFYDRNPYTTVDKLIKSLLNLIGVDDRIEINGFLIVVKSSTLTMIELEVKNISTARQIINKEHFSFDDENIEFTLEGGGIVDIDETRLIKIKNPNRVHHSKLKYPTDNSNHIWILC